MTLIYRKFSVLRSKVQHYAKESWRFLTDKQILGTFGANVAIILLGVVGGIIMARALGPEGRGHVAAVLVVANTINWIFNCGLSWGNLYYLNKRPGDIHVILTNSVVFAGIMGVPAICAGILAVGFLFADYPSGVRLSALVYFATVPVAMGADYLIFAQQALRQFRYFNIMRVSRQGIQTILLGTLILGNVLTATTAIVVVTIANMVIAFAAIFWFKRYYWRGLIVNRELLKQCLKFGLKAYFGSLAQTGNRRLDQMLMVFLVSPTELGLYSVATSISEGVSIVPSTVATVTSARVAHTGGLAGWRLLKKNIVLVGLLVGILVFFSVIGADLIMKLLYGDAFSAAVTPFRILLLAAWFLGMGDLTGQGLTGLGRPILSTISEVAALVLTIVMLLVLVPKLGILGAAFASLGAYALRFLLFVGFALRKRFVEGDYK